MRKLLRTLGIFYIIAELFLTPGVGLEQTHAQAADDVTPSGYMHMTNSIGAKDDVAPGMYAHVTNLPPAYPTYLRAPLATDDTTAGYSVGDFWNSTAGLFQAQRVTANAASWQQYYSTQAPLPADVATVNTAYGTCKLAAAYGGPLLQIVRASDTALKDIYPSTAFNNCLDEAAINQFCAGTTCKVPTWYDQVGGNHATQTTDANRPVIVMSSRIGKSLSVVCPYQFNQSSVVTICQMIIPNGMTFGTTNGYTIANISRTVASTRDINFFEGLNGSFPLRIALWTQGAATTTGLYYRIASNLIYATQGTTATGPSFLNQPQSPSLYMLNYKNVAASVQQIMNNSVSTSDGIGTGTYTGGTLMGRLATTATSGMQEMAALVVYPNWSTAAVSDKIRASMISLYGLTPQIHDQIIWDGDSITQGQGTTYNQGYPRRAETMMGSPTTVPVVTINQGWYGKTMANLLTDYPITVAGQFNSAYRNNILSVFAGTNDNDGLDAACSAIYANMVSYVSLAHTTGWKVILGTMLPRSSGNWNAAKLAEMAACNVLIRANSAGADGIADFNADPTMGPNAAANDVTLYGDGIHPTDLGYGYLTPIAVAAANKLLK